MRSVTPCEVEKADAHFAKKGRGLSKVCKSCESGIEGGKALAAQSAPTDLPPQPITISDALEVLPGFGFRATVEDDHLVIEQDNSEGATDSLVLSRTEAKVLFAQFGEWAA